MTHPPLTRQPVDLPAAPSRGPAGLETPPFWRDLLSVMLAFRDGDFSARLPSDLVGVEGKIADTFNEVLAVSASRAREIRRVSFAVGKEGKLRHRMDVASARGG